MVNPKTKYNMKRLFKDGLITTLLGVAIILSAVVAWMLDTPIDEVVLIAGYGFIFLRAKDSLIGIEK
jgi:hypothetical protein